MLSMALEMQAGRIAVPPHLMDLLGRAQRSVEIDPKLTRRCLDEITRFFSGRPSDTLEHALIPSLVSVEGPASVKGGLAAWQIRRVRDHVEARLDETILIEDLAAVAKLSSGHFCRAFKVSTGETPHGFVIRQRIRRAQVLMLSTQDSLSQIACACGLTDQAHLTRLFRRFVDHTPLAWRRAWRAA